MIGYIFSQTPSSHLHNGSGCLKCAANRISKLLTKTVDEFVNEAIKIHGTKYDYSDVKYENCEVGVDIKCNTCGYIFSQIPSSHLRSHGCPKCAINKNRKFRTKTTEQFIEKAVKKHGTKYDYSNVKYENCKVKVDIKCNTCGYIFSQTPGSHLYHGSGCPNCDGKIITTDIFIKKCIEKHGDKYDYSGVEYATSITSINIQCNRCKNVFLTTSNRLLDGHGCPNCAKIDKMSILYKHNLHDLTNLYLIQLKSKSEVFLKVGISTNIKKRCLRFERVGYTVKLLKSIEGIGFDIFEFEKNFLKHYNKFKYTPKIEFQGYTECLDISLINHLPTDNWYITNGDKLRTPIILNWL